MGQEQSSAGLLNQHQHGHAQSDDIDEHNGAIRGDIPFSTPFKGYARMPSASSVLSLGSAASESQDEFGGALLSKVPGVLSPAAAASVHSLESPLAMGHKTANIIELDDIDFDGGNAVDLLRCSSDVPTDSEEEAIGTTHHLYVPDPNAPAKALSAPSSPAVTSRTPNASVPSLPTASAENSSSCDHKLSASGTDSDQPGHSSASVSTSMVNRPVSTSLASLRREHARRTARRVSRRRRRRRRRATDTKHPPHRQRTASLPSLALEERKNDSSSSKRPTLWVMQEMCRPLVQLGTDAIMSMALTKEDLGDSAELKAIALLALRATDIAWNSRHTSHLVLGPNLRVALSCCRGKYLHMFSSLFALRDEVKEWSSLAKQAGMSEFVQRGILNEVLRINLFQQAQPTQRNYALQRVAANCAIDMPLSWASNTIALAWGMHEFDSFKRQSLAAVMKIKL